MVGHAAMVRLPLPLRSAARACRRRCRNAQGNAQIIRFDQFQMRLPWQPNPIILVPKAGADPVGASSSNSDQPP
jgi:hypothetical protein